MVKEVGKFYLESSTGGFALFKVIYVQKLVSFQTLKDISDKSKTDISRQLKPFVTAKWVTQKREGRNVYFEVNPAGIKKDIPSYNLSDYYSQERTKQLMACETAKQFSDLVKFTKIGYANFNDVNFLKKLFK